MNTVIEHDAQHTHLRMRAYEALVSGKLTWRHHGIGMLQAYVEEGGDVEHRLHIWSRSLVKPGIEQSGNVHDHRFTLVSHVLVGSIEHNELQLTPDPRGTWTTMELTHARAAGPDALYHAPMRPTGLRYRPWWRNYFIDEGAKYTFARGKFHRSPVRAFAVTWVEKLDQSTEPARIAHEVDMPPVAAFGHEPDPEHIARLVQLATDVLAPVREGT